MKPKFTRSLIGVCLGLCLLVQSPAAWATPGSAKEDPEKKEVTKGKVSTSRNNSSVRIFPDIVKRVMHVVAKGNEGTTIDFFVFDLEGAIVKHYRMTAGGHEKLAGLERGRYVFRVFSGDEETATGNLEIR